MHGPLLGYIEQDKLLNVDPVAVYWVLLHVELVPEGCAGVHSQPIRTKAAVPPDPPVIDVQVVGLEQRRELEKRVCDLVHRRDRLGTKQPHGLHLHSKQTNKQINIFHTHAHSQLLKLAFIFSGFTEKSICSVAQW